MRDGSIEKAGGDPSKERQIEEEHLIQKTEKVSSIEEITINIY